MPAENDMPNIELKPHQNPPDIEKKALEQEKKISNPLARFNLNTAGPEKTNKKEEDQQIINQEIQHGHPNNPWLPKHPIPDKTVFGRPQRMLPPAQPSQETIRQLQTAEVMPDPNNPEQQFGVYKANWESLATNPDSAVTVFYPPYANAHEDHAANYRLQEIATVMPERPLLAIDYPGSGKSSPATKEQMDTSKENGFIEIADAQLRVMKSMGVKTINLVGPSMGAAFSLAVASEANKFGIKVDNLCLYEIPGVRYLSFPGLALLEGSEAGNIDLHSSLPYDPNMHEASKLDIPPTQSPMEMFKHMQKVDPKFFAARFMAKNTVNERIGKVLEKQPEAHIFFINGSESKVSKPEKINKIVQHYRTTDNKIYANRIHRSIYPGEGHNPFITAKRLAADINLRLNRAPSGTGTTKETRKIN